MRLRSYHRPSSPRRHGATASAPFSVTNTPDDSGWRSAITSITVNGTNLPAAAYFTNEAGLIVFDPSQSALLQSPGVKNIVVSATGYSTNSIIQTIAGSWAQPAITTQPKAPVANGVALATQPVVAVQDAFGNAVASTASIVAAVRHGLHAGRHHDKSRRFRHGQIPPT